MNRRDSYFVRPCVARPREGDWLLAFIDRPCPPKSLALALVPNNRDKHRIRRRHRRHRTQHQPRRETARPPPSIAGLRRHQPLPCTPSPLTKTVSYTILHQLFKKQQIRAIPTPPPPPSNSNVRHASQAHTHLPLPDGRRALGAHHHAPYRDRVEQRLDVLRILIHVTDVHPCYP